MKEQFATSGEFSAMDEVGLSLSVSHVPVICVDLRTSNVCSPIKKKKKKVRCVRERKRKEGI